jgi:large subunit ribosomal protein L18
MNIKNIKNTKNMNKRLKRLHRARKARECIKRLGMETGVCRLTLFRSNRNIFAQILSPVDGKVLASASSIEKDFNADASEGKIGLSKKVGQLIAERAKAAVVERVACDRSGFKYHGRIAALVESARENGLQV